MKLNLQDYDVLLVNTSGGKDSQTTLRHVVAQARQQGVFDRVRAVHAILREEEWPGAMELAELQARHYGVPFHTVQRSQGLLEHIRQRGKWPSPSCRYCTSDHKRDQVARLVTQLAHQHQRGRQARILNCMGMRAEESPARAKLYAFTTDWRLTNSKRLVDRWLPIHTWSAEEVWRDIRESGVPYHFAYDLGMPRLSCCFCIFAPRAALLLAGLHNRPLLDRYVAVEEAMRHTFRKDLSLRSIAEALDAGERPQAVSDWRM